MTLEGTFSGARFQIEDHKYSLAADSLKIWILLDWINAERKNLACLTLSAQYEADIDNILLESSEEGMNILEEQAQKPILENVNIKNVRVT